MNRIKVLLLAGLLTLPLAACGEGGILPQRNPVATAQTTEQKAAALYGQFVIAEEAARDLVCPNYTEVRANPALRCKPTVPPGVTRAIASADRVAKPLADVLSTAALRYAEAKRRVDEAKASGATNTELIVAGANAALNALQRAYEEASPSIKALIAAIKAHKEKE